MTTYTVTPPTNTRDNETMRYAQSSEKPLCKPESVLKERRDTAWCVNQWDNWARWKNNLFSERQCPAIPSPITSLRKGEFMEMFVLEVCRKKMDPSTYMYQMLYITVFCIMRQHRLL